MIAFFISAPGWHTALVLLMLGGGLIVSVAIALFHIYRYNGAGTLSAKFLWSENQSLKAVSEKVSSEKIPLAPEEVFDSDILEKIQQVPDKKSLIFDRLKTIIGLQKSYSRISLDVLQLATQTKEAASKTLDIPSYFVGFAMLIGLLGTIIGLSIMIGNMQDALPQQVSIEIMDKSRGKVQEVLGSMQSAFWATMGGLFCSIVSSLFNYFMHICQARFYKKLDNFTVEELLPLVYSSKETSDLLKDANENIEKTFSKLQNIGQDISDNTQKLNAVHESFNTIISNLERITQNPLRNEMQQIFQQLSLAIAETAKTNQSVQDTVGYIPQVLELMEKNNQQNQSVFSQYAHETQKRRESTANYSAPAPRQTVSLPDRKTRPVNPGQSGQESIKINIFKHLNRPMTAIISASIVGAILLFFIMWFLNS